MAGQKKLLKTHYETLAALRYALRKFTHFSERAAREAGITPQQHQAMLVIKGFPGRDYVTVGELAERLQRRPHSAVELIDRLVTEKLVTRSTSPKDQRQVWISLSSHGEKMLERLSTVHHAELERIGPELTLLLEQLTAIRKSPAVAR